MHRFPLYYEAKIMFFVYLLVPSWQGWDTVFDRLLKVRRRPSARLPPRWLARDSAEERTLTSR